MVWVCCTVRKFVRKLISIGFAVSRSGLATKAKRFSLIFPSHRAAIFGFHRQNKVEAIAIGCRAGEQKQQTNTNLKFNRKKWELCMETGSGTIARSAASHLDRWSIISVSFLLFSFFFGTFFFVRVWTLLNYQRLQDTTRRRRTRWNNSFSNHWDDLWGASFDIRGTGSDFPTLSRGCSFRRRHNNEYISVD